jgi:fermentation-respiration switch protein FrsA (DUF1100 family)
VDKISCRSDFAIPVYSGCLKVKDMDEPAPGLRIVTNAPPVFLVHGGDDIISPRLVEDAAVSVLSPTRVELTWKASEDKNVTGYHVERAAAEVLSEDQLER